MELVLLLLVTAILEALPILLQKPVLMQLAQKQMLPTVIVLTNLEDKLLMQQD